MKNFSIFLRHFQLINCKIVIYATKELKCLLRGESLEPSFDSEAFKEYMNDLKNGIVKPLPMGAYEYGCCVDYLKIIKRELLKTRCRTKFMTLTFSEHSKNGVIFPPLEDCLNLVAKEAGFAVVCEKIKKDSYNYTLKSTLGE